MTSPRRRASAVLAQPGCLSCASTDTRARNLEPRKRGETKSRGGKRRDAWLAREQGDRELSALHARSSELLQSVPPDQAGAALVPRAQPRNISRVPRVQSLGVVEKNDALKLPRGSPSEFNEKLDEAQLCQVKQLALPEPKSDCPLWTQIVNSADFLLLQASDSSSLKLRERS